MKTKMSPPEHHDVWRGSHLDWSYKIVLHGKGKPYCAGGQGTWCYYVYIPEVRIGKQAFAKLWLPVQETKYSFEHFDYFNTPVADLDWHGGVTYYQKYGETEGKRVVEFGCDYNHLYDNQERWSLERVLLDLQQTIEQLTELYPANETNRTAS